MVETKVVSIKELTDPEENPTLCLSPRRVFNKCHECEVYKRHLQCLRGVRKRADKQHVLKCKPHLDEKYKELIAQKQNLLDMIKYVDEQMANL